MPALEKEKLPEGARILLDALVALEAHGERWVQRTQIAKHIGKRRLTAADMAFLQTLDALGYIDSTHTDTHTPMGYKWVYRLREDID